MTSERLEGNKGFDSVNLDSQLLRALQELKFSSMTPIQAEAIPILLSGRDLIGRSQTGSGKTLAFGLPILNRLKLRERRIQALILCPTRELCDQVARELRRVGRHLKGFHVQPLTGGQPIFAQLKSLRKGCHLIVGTPGRIMDHMRRNSLDLASVKTVVLDEADRMLDMGFQEDMATILSALSPEKQTVFFSATFPRSIQGMSEKFQKNPVSIEVASDDVSAPSIQQEIMEVTSGSKLDVLLAIISEKKPSSALVFCNLKNTVDELSQALMKAGVSVEGIHGDLEQGDRNRVMAKFRNQSVRVLVATDVAARGIDVNDLEWVVNFDLPMDPEVYVHRIGRTGRAGKNGLAISIYVPSERNRLRAIEEWTQNRFEIQKVGLPYEREMHPTGSANAFVPKMETIFISGGRKDKVRPGDILGALTGEAGGFAGSQIGKIEIHDRFSYVAVDREIADLAVTRLLNGKIKGRKFIVKKVR